MTAWESGRAHRERAVVEKMNPYLPIVESRALTDQASPVRYGKRTCRTALETMNTRWLFARVSAGNTKNPALSVL